MDYYEIADLPGVQYFRCERMLASLSTNACASNWRLANDERDPRRERCKGCAIGALHAGESGLNLSPLRGTNTCSRCHRGAPRLIRKHLCVSCANREYEMVKGRNAKGHPPVTHPPLDRRSVSYLSGGQVKMKTVDLTTSLDELIVAVLRDERKEVQFQFRAAESVLQLVEGMDRSLDYVVW
jgi:hypothetical protein